jgi:hypothetical protein
MTKQIRDAITNRIYEQFGDDYNIEIESKEQGFTTPCFFVQMLETQEIAKPMNRYLLINPVKIVYFPKSEYEPMNECYGVQSDIKNILHYITLADGTKLRGTDIRTVVVGKQLHAFVNYDFYATKDGDTSELMGVLERR